MGGNRPRRETPPKTRPPSVHAKGGLANNVTSASLGIAVKRWLRRAARNRRPCARPRTVLARAVEFARDPASRLGAAQRRQPGRRRRRSRQRRPRRSPAALLIGERSAASPWPVTRWPRVRTAPAIC